MKYIKSILILIIISDLLRADNIKLMTEIFPPYQHHDTVNNKLIGISTEIVQEIQKRVNNTNKIKIYPWARGMKIVNKKENIALFSMLRTKERENKYKWVGPLSKIQLLFFKKKGSDIVLNSIEDARKVKKIGVTKNVANYDILTSKGFKNLDVISSGADEKNIKKLVKKRIDLWLALKISGLYSAKSLGFKGEIVPIDNVIVFEGNLYIAFNKKTEDKIISKWQKALEELELSGTIDKIKERY